MVETARVVPLWGVEMGVHAERRALVQNFRRLAQRYDILRVSDTASKAASTAMVDEILATPGLSIEDRDAVLAAKDAYDGTFYFLSF